MMLRITVEVWPKGDQSQRKVLDTIDVEQIASSPEDIADYVAAWETTTRADLNVERFTVRRHRRFEGRWRLLERVIAEIADRCINLPPEPGS
jgi:hypothetical protein